VARNCIVTQSRIWPESSTAVSISGGAQRGQSSMYAGSWRTTFAATFPASPHHRVHLPVAVSRTV